MAEFKNIDSLLIEDNPGDARLIREYLKESFLQFQPVVDVAENLKEAIDYLHEEEYDIILLDLSLPESFGLDTFKKVDNIAGAIPIIVLTGLDDEKLGVEAVQLGAQDFLIKRELNSTLLGRAILYSLQRSQLSQRLEESQERLQQAQELAHIGNYEMDLENGEIIWSDETFRIFDMSPNDKEPRYNELKEMLHPDYRRKIDETIKKVREKGEREYLELGFITQKGSTKYVYSVVDPIENKKGEVIKIFGTTQDITNRKKAEEQLKESERRYRMLFQATTDEILVFQLDDKMKPLPFLEVNDGACEILGYTREELQEKTIYDVVAADKEDVQKRIAEIVKNEEQVRESQHICKEGDLIPLEISARSFVYDGRTTILSIGRDVRERRKLEQEILNISERERQRIGQDMHDDLGQMLTGIGLIAQTLANDLKAKDSKVWEKVQEIADMVKEADEHARALARGLVPVNIESNGLDNALHELATKSSKMYEIDISYFNGKNNSIDDNSSAVHLYRIAQESINNAIKHGNATNIDVELISQEQNIILRIEDDGSGFPEQGKMGDGMGVRIMKFRAQMIGGNLEINSEQGKGTEIVCQVPIQTFRK